TFRLDLSDQYVVITKEDPQAPGMRADKGSYFYQAYLDDLRLTFDQGRILPRAPSSFDPADLTPATVRGLFTNIGLSLAVSDSVLAQVVELARASENPYA